MKGNFQVRFLGEGAAVMPSPYPTLKRPVDKNDAPSLSRAEVKKLDSGVNRSFVTLAHHLRLVASNITLDLQALKPLDSNKLATDLFSEHYGWNSTSARPRTFRAGALSTEKESTRTKRISNCSIPSTNPPSWTRVPVLGFTPVACHAAWLQDVRSTSQ